MRRTTALVAAGLTLLGADYAQGQGSGALLTLHVDCAAAPGGSGSRQAPFKTVSAAVEAGRAMSVHRRIAIRVAAGACSSETLPLLLDYPVDLAGSRLPQLDSFGLPTGEQSRDTLITRDSGPAPTAFFLITADGVRAARLSVDGQLAPPPDQPIPPPSAPIGLLVRSAHGVLLEQLRLVGVAQGIRSEGAGGRVSENYVEALGNGLVFLGGDSARSPAVIVNANRVNYRVNGIVLAAGIPAVGAQPAGSVLSALVVGNDVFTHYRNIGPSNPTALRVSPSVQGAPEGHLSAQFLLNAVRGTPKYSIMVHGGQPQRDGSVSSGSVRATFLRTTLDVEARQTATSLVSFTNARATELPCELNSANGPDVCPLLQGNPPAYSDYHQKTTYDLRHSGELDGALIDHPAIEPVDGRELGNLLLINGVVVGYQTFVVVP